MRTKVSITRLDLCFININFNFISSKLNKSGKGMRESFKSQWKISSFNSF